MLYMNNLTLCSTKRVPNPAAGKSFAESSPLQHHPYFIIYIKNEPNVRLFSARQYKYSVNISYLCRYKCKSAMENESRWTQTAAYFVIFFGVWAGLAAIPPKGGYMWEPWTINILTTSFFTLFVYLTAHLARTGQTFIGIIGTAAFIVFFFPGEETFFYRDLNALIEISSQCIVPFFITQYTRVSQKEFQRWYFLMLLMGIFCSYTHDGITIPLCCTFVWLAFQRRERFFRQACWPMVVGVIIGTGLSIWQRRNDSLNLATNLEAISSVTSIALQTLWETKVFVLTVLLTGYMASQKKGRKDLRYIVRRHYVMALCMLFALLTMPFAPLGIDNAVTGVCFFSMFWLLFLCQYLAEKYLKRKI